MDPIRVCIVCGSCAALEREFEDLEAELGVPVEVQYISTEAGLRIAHCPSLVVVDLTSPLPIPPRHFLKAVPSGLVTILLWDDQSVPAAWLPFLRAPHVRLLWLRSKSQDPFIAARALVHQWALRMRGVELANAVIQSAPGLAAVEPLVVAILEHPWHIRRAQDLAHVSGVPAEALSDQCGVLGAEKVEHFITTVRALALEHLVNMGIRSKHAHALVGIDDPSNFKRQLARAEYFLRKLA